MSEPTLPSPAMLGWEFWLPLIVKYGIPGAHEIWRIVSSNPTPTPEAWNALLAVNAKSLQSYVDDAAAKLGLHAPPAPP